MAVLLALIREKKTVRTWNILQGKTQFSGHLFMSGIYNVGFCTTINLVKEKQNGSITKDHTRGVLGTPHLVKSLLKVPPPLNFSKFALLA